jgi:site-specific DNA-adenine methylase
MRYLGGKYRIRKWLAAEIAPYRTPGHILWEPFCGGLNSSEALLPDLCSDIDESLIALYQAVQAGWEPPAAVDEELYRYARTLPESNPLHGFCAFGCSFGGKKWGGFASAYSDRVAPTYANTAARRLRLSLEILRLCYFDRVDFLSVLPYAIDADIYCDPPYRGTAGYAHAFDHDRFIACAQEWSRYTTVLVSEYAWPNWAGVQIAECTRNVEMQTTKGARTERLFLVTP